MATKDLQIVVVKVTESQGRQFTVQLSNDETLIVGSGGSCGIRLTGEDVAPLHCVLRLADGELLLQNWGAANGTSVDGTPVSEDAVVGLHQAVRVGENELRFATPDEPEIHEPESVEHRSMATATPETPVTSDSVDEIDELIGVELPVADAQDASCSESNGFAAEEPLAPAERSNVETKVISPVVSPVTLPPPELDPEMLELLRAEVDCLEAELAERDRQLIELRESSPGESVGLEEVDAAETERLLSRLEDLLDELQRSDERVRVAEELLLAEQEVTRSQNEEQQEIQGWIAEIEDRIEAREDEWKAEREALNRRLEQAKTDRDEVDRRLSLEVNDAQQETLVRELRSELDQVRETLDVAMRREAAAIEKIKELRERSPESLDEEQIANAVREERLLLAEERAALSRERAEVTKLKSELESQPNEPIASSRKASDTDIRFNEFRKTLRELHEEDRREAPPQKTLGKRIADLWARLDGKLDTV